jgi:hypothetical protein
MCWYEKAILILVPFGIVTSLIILALVEHGMIL